MLKFKNIISVNIWPSSVTLTWSREKGNMGSAHSLGNVIISAQFEKYPSIGIGFIERTR